MLEDSYEEKRNTSVYVFGWGGFFTVSQFLDISSRHSSVDGVKLVKER